MARRSAVLLGLLGSLLPQAASLACVPGVDAADRSECAMLVDDDQSLNLFQITGRKQSSSPPVTAYTLPPLPYSYDALEPAIDERTMHLHHDKHHNTYVTNINKELSSVAEKPALVDLQRDAITKGAAVRNNGGGAYNHNFFWLVMAPFGRGGSPSAKLEAAMDATFGSLAAFKDKFESAGAPGARFGSGWVWLVLTKDRKLEITSTPNQDNPLMEGADCTSGIPILALDVWEHAYYLKYEWNRTAYLKAWWDVVNWHQVNAWYEDALSGKPPSTV